jgi:HD domain
MDAQLPIAYTKGILDRLSRQACELLQVERACIFVRDEDTLAPLPVAGHGIPDELSGRGLPLDDAMVVRVLSKGVPVLLNAAVGAPIEWDGEVRGAMTVATTDPGRVLAGHELERLCDLAQLAGMALEHAHTRRRLERLIEAGAEVLARAVDMRDSYTAGHSEEMAGLVCQVGLELGLEPGELIELEFAARLHDLGKIGVPDQILRKPGPLTRQEWEAMRGHPELGAEMLAEIPGLERVAEIVKGHHERFDGAGYPEGLGGAEIPLASRILSACDAYQAMVSDRPYRRALGVETALRELCDQSGLQFDPAAVQALVRSAEGLARTDAGRRTGSAPVPERGGETERLQVKSKQHEGISVQTMALTAQYPARSMIEAP